MPRQFPGADFHDLNLDWMLNQVKTMITEWATTRAEWASLSEAFAALEQDWETEKTWFENYLETYNLEHYSATVMQFMGALVANGQLLNLISPTVQASSEAAAETWLAANISPESGYAVDKSLTTGGAAADARAAGAVITGAYDTIQRASGTKIGTWSWYNTTTPAVGTTVQKGTRADYISCVLPVQYGDIVHFKSTTSSSGGTTGRRYVITDSNNVSLGVAGNSPYQGEYTVQILFADAAYIYINNNISANLDYWAYVGETAADKVITKQDANVAYATFNWANLATTDNPTGWQAGMYNDSGASSASTDYIRTNPTVWFQAEAPTTEITVTVPTGYCIQISEFSDTNTFVRNVSDRDKRLNTVTMPVVEGYYYRFCVGTFSGDGATYAANATFIGSITMTLKRAITAWETEQDNRLTALELVQDPTIPAYYNTAGYLQSRIDAVTTLQKTVSPYNEQFIYITDYHHQYNTGNSLPLIRRVMEKTGIRKVFFGGDSGGSAGTTDSARLHALQASAQDWHDLGQLGPMYGVLGNHEWISSAVFGIGAMFGAYLNRYDLEISTLDQTTGAYYVDNNKNKIRYIFLQDTASSYPIDGSLAWLYSVLMTLQDGWSVAVIMHHVWIPAAAWSAETDGDYEPTYNYTSIKRVSKLLAGCRDKTVVDTYDFTSLTGTRHVIGVFGGHIHHGLMWIDDETTGVENILTFAGGTDCLSASLTNVNSHPWFWEDGVVDGTKVERTVGSIYEQCFYVITIDLSTHVVYATAFGGDHDWQETYEPT